MRHPRHGGPVEDQPPRVVVACVAPVAAVVSAAEGRVPLFASGEKDIDSFSEGVHRIDTG